MYEYIDKIATYYKAPGKVLFDLKEPTDVHWHKLWGRAFQRLGPAILKARHGGET